MEAKNPTIQKLATYIKANPEDSFSKFALALEFLKEDDLKRARLFFENIYYSDPKYVGVYYHLGKLYERTGQFEKAVKMYEEGIEIAAEKKEKRTESELKEALAALKIELEDS